MGFYVNASFILGAPIETKKHIENTIKFAKSIPLDSAVFYNFAYVIGSPIWEEAVKEGKFHIYSVKTIDEGIKVLTGVKAGEKKPNGRFEEDTINDKVNKRLKEMVEHLKEFPGITLGRTKKE